MNAITDVEPVASSWLANTGDRVIRRPARLLGG